MLDHWTTPYTGVFTSLVIYIFATFWLSIFAATLPVPTGVLVPAFKIGAAFGRIVGEGMNMWFPEGFSYEDSLMRFLKFIFLIYTESAIFQDGRAQGKNDDMPTPWKLCQ